MTAIQLKPIFENGKKEKTYNNVILRYEERHCFTWCDGVELSVVVDRGVCETSAKGESAAELFNEGHDVESRSPPTHDERPFNVKSLRVADVVEDAAAFSIRSIWIRSWIWASCSKLSSEIKTTNNWNRFTKKNPDSWKNESKKNYNWSKLFQQFCLIYITLFWH